MKTAYFERFGIDMTLEQALSASHPGDCTSEVRDLLEVPAIKKQLDRIPVESIRAELLTYGAWDETELADDNANRERLIWIAAGDIREANNE